MRRRVGIRGWVAAIVCGTALLAPAGAMAQQGNGLYDPFPDPTTSRTAERYYAELGVAVTGTQLDAGHALSGLPAVAGPRGPSDRAGVSAGPSASWAVGVLLGAVLLIAGGGLLVTRRAGRRGGAGATAATLLVAGVVAGALCFAGGPAADTARAATVPRDFLGLTTDDVFAGSDAYQASTMAAQRAMGATVLRQTFNWRYLEPFAGVFNFTATDRFVLAAARARLRVLPILFGETAWASSRWGGDGRRVTAPPKDPRTFAAFAAQVAQRYGTGGTLWQAHPEVAPLPITSFQVWNEPNLPLYWAGRPNAKAYASLLKRTASAVRRVQPAARIVSAGLPHSPTGAPLLTYLRQLYDAGAGPSIDTLGINPYSTSVAGMMSLLRQVRAQLDRSGARGTEMWITELGWADRGKSRFSVGSTKQAEMIGDVLRTLGRSWRPLRLLGVVYYAWRDAPPYAGVDDFWGLHTGLYRIDGTAKPAAAALRKAMTALR